MNKIEKSPRKYKNLATISVARDGVFYVKILTENSVFFGLMAAQVYLVRPFGSHPYLGGPEGLSMLMCCLEPHKKNPSKSMSGNTGNNTIHNS